MAGRVVACLCAIAVLASADSASALVAHWYQTRTEDFAGTACGATDSFSLRLAKGAFGIRARPAVGSAFRDFETGALVARLTDVEIDRSEGAPRVVFTATGSGDTCANPSTYADNGWVTDDIKFRVDYKSRVHVFGPSSCFTSRYRPTTIVIACGDGNFFVKHIHWSSWRDSRAKGHGTAYANDCIPYCAAGHFHTYPINLKLSHRRYCSTSGRYQFTRLDVAYPGAYPGGKRAYHLGFRCTDD